MILFTCSTCANNTSDATKPKTGQVFMQQDLVATAPFKRNVQLADE